MKKSWIDIKIPTLILAKIKRKHKKNSAIINASPEDPNFDTVARQRTKIAILLHLC